jgi:predicted metalloprotease with PDZ domain
MLVRVIFLIFIILTTTVHAQVIGILGVRLEPCPDGCGLVIQEVMPGSPAAYSGLRQGDVIKKLNGIDVYDNINDVLEYFRMNPNRIVHITISRYGFMQGGYVRLGVKSVSDQQHNISPIAPGEPNVYPHAEPKGNLTINVFGNIEQKNETHQSGTGNISEQSNERE